MKKIALLGLCFFIVSMSCKTKKKSIVNKTETTEVAHTETKKSFLDSLFEKMKSHSDSLNADIKIKASETTEEESEQAATTDDLSLVQTGNWVGGTKHLDDRDSLVMYDYDNPSTQIKGVTYGDGTSRVTLFKNGKKRTVKNLDIEIKLHQSASSMQTTKAAVQKTDNAISNDKKIAVSKEVKKASNERQSLGWVDIKGWLIFGGLIIVCLIIHFIIKTKTKQ